MLLLVLDPEGKGKPKEHICPQGFTYLRSPREFSVPGASQAADAGQHFSIQMKSYLSCALPAVISHDSSMQVEQCSCFHLHTW